MRRLAWSGSRWLESFGDQIGDPVSWVSLGYQSHDGESTVLIETFSRPRVNLVCGELPMEHMAGYACTVLINITLPERSESFPDGFLRALGHLSEEQSEQCAHWPLIRWRVDGTAVPARVWRFAGGWAAVSDAVESVYLAAVGIGTEPDALSLAILPDGDAHYLTWTSRCTRIPGQQVSHMRAGTKDVSLAGRSFTPTSWD